LYEWFNKNEAVSSQLNIILFIGEEAYIKLKDKKTLSSFKKVSEYKPIFIQDTPLKILVGATKEQKKLPY